MALCAFAGVTDPANDSVATTAINRILALQRLFIVFIVRFPSRAVVAQMTRETERFGVVSGP
jgi:hypothetical protein